MTEDTPQSRAAAAYNAAADCYDAPALSFWDRFGRRTVERLSLPPGARVLDVCCGAGASALPAAERVGPVGRVLGIDLAENLLARAREKARARGLDNTTFRPVAFSGFTFIFNVEAGKVTSLTFKNPQTTMQMKRVD